MSLSLLFRFRALITFTRTYTHTYTRAYARIEYTDSKGREHSRWGGGRGGLGIVCPREVCRKNRQRKVGRCKTSGRLSCGNTPVRVIGFGVYRGEVTGNRPRLTDVALPLCKRLSLSSGVSAVLQSHSGRVLSSPRPTVGYPDNAAALQLIGREVIKQNWIMQTSQNVSVNRINAYATQTETNDIKCFSKQFTYDINIYPIVR